VPDTEISRDKMHNGRAVCGRRILQTHGKLGVQATFGVIRCEWEEMVIGGVAKCRFAANHDRCIARGGWASVATGTVIGRGCRSGHRRLLIARD
jgi:hypothetical protein